MGQTTPNMSIYIPAAGETNYDASFAAGMMNVDQHNHSGAPNEGVPISTSGIADGSITYNKLNANVVDTSSGLGTHTGALENQITTTGLLLSLAQLVSSVGLLGANGTAVTPLTITGTANQITVTNGNGVGGNPTISVPTIQTNTTQPGFFAYANALLNNVTGDGTIYTIPFNTTLFDQNTNFSSSTTFTAPVNGLYLFTISIVINGLTSSHTTGAAHLVSSASQAITIYLGNPFASAAGGDSLSMTGSGILQLTTGQTVIAQVQVSSGTKVVNVYGTALINGPSSFQGFLLH